jgi:hypothetical protein
MGRRRPVSMAALSSAMTRRGSVRRWHAYPLLPQSGRTGQHASRTGIQHGGSLALATRQRTTGAEVNTGKHAMPRAVRASPVPQPRIGQPGCQRLRPGDEA